VNDAPTQASHEDAPLLALIVPGGHSDITPSTHFEPAMQASEVQDAKESEPAEAVCFPLSQFKQSKSESWEAAAVAESDRCLPTTQSLQVTASVAATSVDHLPAAHTMQPSPVGEYEPAGQARQVYE